MNRCSETGRHSLQLTVPESFTGQYPRLVSLAHRLSIAHSHGEVLDDQSFIEIGEALWQSLDAQTLVIRQELGDMAGICATLFNLCHLHAHREEMNEAIGAWLKTFDVASEIEDAAALSELDQLARTLGGDGLSFWEKLRKDFHGSGERS